MQFQKNRFGPILQIGRREGLKLAEVAPVGDFVGGNDERLAWSGIPSIRIRPL